MRRYLNVGESGGGPPGRRMRREIEGAIAIQYRRRKRRRSKTTGNKERPEKAGKWPRVENSRAKFVEASSVPCDFPLYISIHTKPIISAASSSLARPVLQFFPPRYRRLLVALSSPDKLMSAMATLEINSEITEPREYREKDRDVSRQYR